MALTNEFVVGKKYYRSFYNPCYIETCVCTEIKEDGVEFFSNVDGDFVLPHGETLFDTKEEAKNVLLDRYKEYDPEHDLSSPEAIIKLLYQYASGMRDYVYEPFYSVLLPEKIKEHFGVEVEVDLENEEYQEWLEQNLKI